MLPSDLLTIARAVARGDHARVIEPDNRAGACLGLAEAVTSRKAFFVVPREHLLVVDMDLPGDPRRSADVAAAFDELVDRATHAGVPVLRVSSGRPGHEHAYLVTGPGPAWRRLAGWCSDRGLDVRSRGIRPPGAPHRGGAPVEPVDVVRALAVLEHAPVPAATQALVAALCPLVLPSRVALAVRHGYAHAGYDSPSHARMALAVAVRARGGTVSFVDAVLRDGRSPLGATFRDRDQGWQRAELTRLWSKAGQWISSGGRGDARPQLERVAAAVAACPWRGAAGGSDLAVLEELLRIGYRHRSAVVGAALMDLAVGAGVSTDTARAAVRRLGAAGWLAVVEHETARTTRTYALRVPANVQVAAAPVPVPDVGSVGDLGADHARWRALGKSTVRVARALAEAPQPAAVAAQLGMAPASVRYHVRKLLRCGLVIREGHELRVRTRAHVDVAARLGVAGARKQQVERVCAYRQARAAAREVLASRWFASAVQATPHSSASSEPHLVPPAAIAAACWPSNT